MCLLMESGGLDPRPKPPSILARLFGMTMVLTIFRNLPMEGSTSSGLITSSSSLKVIRIFLLFLIKLSSLEIPIMEIRLVLNRYKVISYGMFHIFHIFYWTNLLCAVLNSVRLSSSVSVSGNPSNPPSASEPAFSSSSMIGRLCCYEVEIIIA